MTSNNPWLKRASVAVAALAVLGSAAPAVAATKYTPDDAGRAYSNGTFVRVYDMEANGESVYSKYDVYGHLEQYRVEVTAGNGEYKDTQDFDDGIERFNACENENNAPDECSSYYNF
jgi:hypothetical protein